VQDFLPDHHLDKESGHTGVQAYAFESAVEMTQTHHSIIVQIRMYGAEVVRVSVENFALSLVQRNVFGYPVVRQAILPDDLAVVATHRALGMIYQRDGHFIAQVHAVGGEILHHEHPILKDGVPAIFDEGAEPRILSSNTDVAGQWIAAKKEFQIVEALLQFVQRRRMSFAVSQYLVFGRKEIYLRSLPCDCGQSAQMIRVHQVVGIEEDDVLPARFNEAAISRRASLGIDLPDIPDSFIARVILPDDLPSVIRAAVVYDDDFKIITVLRENGIERALDERSTIVGWNDDGERRHDD
jgi:hypothetical protein